MTSHLQLAPPADGRPEVVTPIRVILADDHAMARRNLRLMLDREQGIQVTAEAEDIATVLRHVVNHLPHVLVLDLRLPNGSSIAAIRRLREEIPDTEIVVLTMEDSPAFAHQALAAGAIGFVVKDHADAELPSAVRGAARGDEYVSPRVAAKLQTMRAAMNGDGLSPRETEVLRLIALGHTSAEIAERLHLSRRTIETHRARIHDKLGLRTRAQLVQYALGRHLIGD